MKLKRLTAFLLLTLTVFTLSSCSEEYYEASFTGVFDTYVQVYSYSENRMHFSEVVNEGVQMLNEYHRLYDIYNSYDGINNIKTINDNAGISPVEVDGKIIDLLMFCKDAYYLTEGNVNVAMGSVLKLWHDARLSVQTNALAKIPSMAELENAALHTNIEDIVIDKENSTVFIKDPLLSIDVGSVAKGYATQKVSEYFIQNGLDSGFLSVGGNVKILGIPKDGKDPGWKIGIQDPDQTKTDPVDIIMVHGGSLATSGDYQRYFVSDGVKYHHIIDKDTLMPSEGMQAVSVWVEDSAMADVLSTYFFTVSYEQAVKFIEDNPAMGINAYWINNDGKIMYTDAMEEYLQ